jgi:hypothetical protein
MEYLAQELVFEFFYLFCNEDKARHLLCYMMKTNTFERDPPQLFVGKGPEAYMFNNINISIRLYGFSPMNSLKSQILKGEKQLSELIELCEFSSTDKWTLLYRGTRDGFGVEDFHSKCDGHPILLR